MSIKTNKASYVRIIYVLADGVSVLLADDMRISEAQVNHFIEIGDGFIPDAPYGKEILYVYASNVKFNPIKNNIQNGYQIITEGLPEALKKSKGLRANIKVAEAKLEVVTSE